MGDYKSVILRVESLLGFIDEYGFDEWTEEKILELESTLRSCMDLMGSEKQVADSLYDQLYSVLKEVNPSSEIFESLWEKDGDIVDYTELLAKYPMMSIETAKSYTCQEMVCFIDRMSELDEEYFASYKINGHGIRIVYENGVLVSATSRARASAGKDLTSQLKVLQGDFNESIEQYSLVEIRGELCLKTDKLSLARNFNPTIKSAFSAVASLARQSASEAEILLLDFLAYDFICDEIEFSSRSEEFEFLVECGFTTPEYSVTESLSSYSLEEELPEVVKIFEDYYEEFGYFCDGVVFEVNSKESFESYGSEGNHSLGKIALKVGVWEQVTYCGVINDIIWTKGKNKLSPVALVSEEMDEVIYEDGSIRNPNDCGILTAQGNKVRRVPLYEPRNMLILEAYPGNPIWFRYGGEAGVVPCFSDGRLLKEDAIKSMLE